MDNQYPYTTNPRERSQYNMIRTLQSPSVASGPHGRFEGMGSEMQQGGMQRSNLMTPNAYLPQHGNSYGHHHLPPMNTRDSGHSQQSVPYGQMPPRPAQTPPASGSMGFPTSYMSQPPSFSPISQFPGNSSLQHDQQPQHMGMQGNVMPYQTYYPNTTSGIADFRGMTATTHGQSMPDAMAPQYHLSPTSEHEFGPRPPHAVGTQGRRGILPSDEGRPPAVPMAGNKAPKTTIIPPKDENGKYPCPHCNKTYLHAKHLKRHLLRHTGDRPYSCVLCNDTFSRSDILKRHFQKCSIRRGNPTGATHLSNSASWLKKQAKAKASSTGAGAGASGSGQDPRPTTSDSGESGASSQPSGGDNPFDQHNTMSSDVGGGPGASISHNSSLSLQNGSQGPPGGSVPHHQGPGGAPPGGQYGSSGIQASPTTSPGSNRAPPPHMGFYDGPGYQSHNGYMGS